MMNTESVDSTAEASTGHGTGMNSSATSQQQMRQRVLVNLMCYHCDQKVQGMDEDGRPQLHCMMIGGPVNPKSCGRTYAVCGE